MSKNLSVKRTLFTGTLLLTAAGILSRFIGFFYKIFLSRTIGAEGLGIYQLIFRAALWISVSPLAFSWLLLSKNCSLEIASQLSSFCSSSQWYLMQRYKLIRLLSASLNTSSSFPTSLPNSTHQAPPNTSMYLSKPSSGNLSIIAFLSNLFPPIHAIKLFILLPPDFQCWGIQSGNPGAFQPPDKTHSYYTFSV